MGGLTTASAVTAFFGFPSTDLALLSGLVTRVDTILANLCNRPDGFLSASHTEKLDGMYGDRFVLTYTPIVSASVVLTVGGNVVDSDSYTLDDTVLGLNGERLSMWLNGYYPDSGFPSIVLDPANLGDGFRNVSVTYTGGYGSTPIPGDLTQAAMDLTAYLYRRRTRDLGVQSETLGSYAYTNAAGKDQGLSAYLDEIRQLYLEPGGHVRRAVVGR